MRAPYRSGDGQRQADCQPCKRADMQIGMRPDDHPGGYATAQSDRHAVTPTRGRPCCQCRAGPSSGWAVACRTSKARQARSGSLSRSRDRWNRIARCPWRPRGTAPLSGPVPMRAAKTAGRNPTAQGLAWEGLEGAARPSIPMQRIGRGRRRRGAMPPERPHANLGSAAGGGEFA